MLLRLLFLALSTMFTFVRLVPMSDREKDLEILALRHQLAVLQRTVDLKGCACRKTHLPW
ncbi:hypothetical protein [Streptomyces sp. NPDC094472]|uniref:hypothetical protein n=1 Tax=unclassified Streptomyces TaxID=2593676 RepID=UPI003326952D